MSEKSTLQEIKKLKILINWCIEVVESLTDALQDEMNNLKEELQ